MSSTIKKNNKLKYRNQQRSHSDPTTTTTTTTKATDPSQTLSKGQDYNNTKQKEGEQESKRTKRRRTKVGLNDILRRIRDLIVEGRSNSEIQDILQLEERTFYRYMAKIYERDQALFAEQGRKVIATEVGMLKDRLPKSYRWGVAISDNENIKADIR